jgi:N-acetyl-anhydromuramyl-L-alanine amidase AmpD
MKLWYPKAKYTKDLMKVNGPYANKYPQGAVVHFTAGRSLEGDKNAENTVKGGVKNGYAFFVISSTGTVYQNFPLSHWGSHAGVSKHPVLGTSVSRKLVGIEICNAGSLKKKGDKYVSWFDEEYTEAQVRKVSKKDNMQAGIYHKYTEAQEKALVDLIIWMHKNNPKVFSLDLVLGHDEVCAPKGRKNDPGGSLSMSMPELRAHLKKLAII